MSMLTPLAGLLLRSLNETLELHQTIHQQHHTYGTWPSRGTLIELEKLCDASRMTTRTLTKLIEEISEWETN